LYFVWSLIVDQIDAISNTYNISPSSFIGILRAEGILQAFRFISQQVTSGNSCTLVQYLNGDHNAAEDSFKAAQSTASKHGFLQYKALSHELASSYYASRGDTYWEEYNLDRAIEAYSDWQATAKVAELEKKNQIIGTKSTARSSGT